MKEEHRFWLKIIIFFLIIGLIIFIVVYRFKNAIESAYQSDRDDAVAAKFEERVKRFESDSENYNAYVCNSGNENIDAEQNDARCIVETRTLDQQTSYDQILTENEQIAQSDYYSQTRTGFSDGIYGNNNFAEQYQVQGTIEPNTVYQFHMQFGAHVSSSSLTAKEYDTLKYYDGTFTVNEEEFSTILNPQASYKTLFEAGLADEYSNGLLIGTYPEDKSNQVMISNIVAQEICNLNSECNEIDDLLNRETKVELVGILPDGSESKITATIEISGVYLGQPMFNDIILAYDGLNDSDNQTSSDLSNKTLVESYLASGAGQTTTSEDTSTVTEKEASAHQENQKMIENASAGAKQGDADYKQAYTIVYNRSNEINSQFDQIVSKNINAVTYDYHNNQTRVGFTDGIFGDTNFAQQYNISDPIKDDVVYRYYVDLEPINQENFTDDQISNILRNGGDGLVGAGEYVAVLNPQASYSTLSTAKLTAGYDRGLLDGEYPVDGSNQVMISYMFASNLCDQRNDCDNVSDLIGSDYSIELKGLDKEGIEQSIGATFSISGIYYGSTFFNDIILAYDGLNDSDSN